MQEIRPYNAIDNDDNILMKNIILKYLEKEKDIPETLYIYEKAVVVETLNGRKIRMSITDGAFGKTKNVRNHLYMNEYVACKWVRIKKSEW